MHSTALLAATIIQACIIAAILYACTRGQHKLSLHEVPPFLNLVGHKGLKL